MKNLKKNTKILDKIFKKQKTKMTKTTLKIIKQQMKKTLIFSLRNPTAFASTFAIRIKLDTKLKLQKS